MDDLNFKINFEDREIESMHGSFNFIMNKDPLQIEVKEGENLVDLPKDKNFYIDYKSDGLEIAPGVYRDKVKIISNKNRTIKIPLLNFQEIEIIEPPVNNDNKDIPNLVRIDHISPQHRKELLNLLEKYPSIFKTEKDER